MYIDTFRSLNIVFFTEFLKNIPDSHQAGRKPALQQNWQSSEKSQKFKEKTQYSMNTLYVGKKFVTHTKHWFGY